MKRKFPDYLKTVRLFLLPFTILSLTIYLSLYLFSPIDTAFQIGLSFGCFFTLIAYFLEKPNLKELLASIFNLRSLSLLVPGLLIVLVFAFVLSPLVKKTVLENQVLLGLTSLGDYYKHLYVLSTVKTGGLPPPHPFYPQSSLSYYYGYYLIPAALSSVLSIDLAKVFFFYILTTTFIILFVVTRISLAIFRNWYQQLLALVLFIFGTGVDILPTLIQAKSGILTSNHIEYWSQTLNISNYLVNNIFTVLLWVPQHAFASIIVLFTGVMLLKNEKVSSYWLVFAISYSLISSTFVSVALIVWLVLIFLFYKEHRLKIVLSSAISILFLWPYLSEILGRSSILKFGFYMTPFKYLPGLPYWLNCLFTVFTEYGLILLALPIYAFIPSNKKNNYKIIIVLSIAIPIILGLFVKSEGFNDFSMRSILPSQMALPFIMAYLLDKVSTVLWKKTIFVLLLLNLILSITGFFYEIHFKLLDRGVIESKNSEFLIKLREISIPNLAVIDNEDWVFLVPSYGYQSVFSPRLFDSTGYLSNTGLVEQKKYAQQVNDLFIYPDKGSDYRDVLDSRRKKLTNLARFFANHRNLNFIIPKYHGTKDSLNPWMSVFQTINVKSYQISPNFSIFNGLDLSNKLSTVKIIPNLNIGVKETNEKNKIFYLDRGLWEVVGCNKIGSRLKLELNNSYLLFDEHPSSSAELCAGNLYFQSKSGFLNVSESSSFDTLYVSPVVIANQSI